MFFIDAEKLLIILQIHNLRVVKLTIQGRRKHFPGARKVRALIFTTEYGLCGQRESAKHPFIRLGHGAIEVVDKINHLLTQVFF